MPRVPGPGQLEDAAGHLAVERRGVEVPFPGDDQVRPFQPAGQADQPGHEVESWFDPGAEGDEPAREAAGRTAARDVGDVDARLVPVAGRHRHQALAELLDLRRRRALLRPEHGGGVMRSAW